MCEKQVYVHLKFLIVFSGRKSQNCSTTNKVVHRQDTSKIFSALSSFSLRVYVTMHENCKFALKNFRKTSKPLKKCQIYVKKHVLHSK